MSASATTHQLSVRIPERHYAELQRRASREGSPTSSVVRRLLAESLRSDAESRVRGYAEAVDRGFDDHGHARPVEDEAFLRDVRVGNGDAGEFKGSRP